MDQRDALPPAHRAVHGDGRSDSTSTVASTVNFVPLTTVNSLSHRPPSSHHRRSTCRQGHRHGVDMSTPLLLEVTPVDTNPTSFYSGGQGGSHRLQTPVIGSRSPCLSTPHILTWRRPCMPWWNLLSLESLEQDSRRNKLIFDGITNRISL